MKKRTINHFSTETRKNIESLIRTGVKNRRIAEILGMTDKQISNYKTWHPKTINAPLSWGEKSASTRRAHRLLGGVTATKRVPAKTQVKAVPPIKNAPAKNEILDINFGAVRVLIPATLKCEVVPSANGLTINYR